MAFTQAQKKIISRISVEPEEVLRLFKSGKVSLDSFKGESLQNGHTFLHILLTLACEDLNKYKNILDYTLEESKLSLEDSKSGYASESALQSLFFYDERQLRIERKNMPVLQHIIEKHLNLLNRAQTNKILFVLSNYPEHREDIKNLLGKSILKAGTAQEKELNVDSNYQTATYQAQAALINFIIQNDLDSYKLMLDYNPELVKELPYIGTKTNLTTAAASILNAERSNLLSLAIKFSQPIAREMLAAQEVDFLFNGALRTKQQHYSAVEAPKYASVSTLAQAFYKNDIELFKLIWEKCDYHKELLCFQQHVPTKIDKGTVLSIIMAGDSSSDIYRFVQHELIHNKKLHTANILLEVLNHKDIALSDKKAITHAVVSVGAPLNKNTLLNAFTQHTFNKFANPEYDLSLKDIEYTAATYSALKSYPNGSKEFANEYSFHSILMEKPALLDALISSGLDMSKAPSGMASNPLTPYLNMLHGFTESNLFNYLNETDLQAREECLKLIIDKYPQELLLPVESNRRSNKKINFLQACLNAMDEKLLTLLPQSIIQEYKGSVQLSSMFSSTTIFQERHNKIYKELFERGFSFFSTNNFYPVLRKCSDFSLLDAIVEREGKDFYTLSRDSEFWENIKSPETALYVKSKGANFQQPELALSLRHNSPHALYHYLTHGGDLNARDDNGNNLLHICIKEKKYRHAAMVLEHCPGLSEHTNNQKKVPLSYLITQVNDFCKNRHPNPLVGQSMEQKELFHLFELYMDKGCFGVNNKAKIFLNSQIEKYHANLSRFFPNIKQWSSYKNIQSALLPVKDLNEASSTARKIKI